MCVCHKLKYVLPVDSPAQVAALVLSRFYTNALVLMPVTLVLWNHNW